MTEPSTIPDVSTLVLVACAAAPLAWLLTQLGRSALKRVVEGRARDPFWWQWSLRLLSAGAGAACGAVLLPGPWGLLAGLAGGVLASTVVAAAKAYVRRWAKGG